MDDATVRRFASSWDALAPLVTIPPLEQAVRVRFAGGTEFGQANRFVHIWPYPSLDARVATRKKAVADGLWPPGGGPDTLITQATKIVMPSPFSPMQ
jgi:hypothetical protein